MWRCKTTAITSCLLALQTVCLTWAGAADQTITRQTSTTEIRQMPTITREEILVGPAEMIVKHLPAEIASSLPVARSNYSQRLCDLMDQITLGFEKGWLTRQQADDLKNWQADVVKEEAILRQADGGVLSRANADLLERHVNSLAFMITHEINLGNMIAGTNKPQL